MEWNIYSNSFTNMSLVMDLKTMTADSSSRMLTQLFDSGLIYIMILIVFLGSISLILTLFGTMNYVGLIFTTTCFILAAVTPVLMRYLS